MEKAARKTLEKQVQERQALLKQMDAAPAKAEPKPTMANQTAGQQQEAVEGYKMKEVKPADETTEVSASGVQWYGAFFVVLLLLLFVLGVRRKKR